MPSRTLPDDPCECVPRLHVVVDNDGQWGILLERDGQQGIFYFVNSNKVYKVQTMSYESATAMEEGRLHYVMMLQEDDGERGEQQALDAMMEVNDARPKPTGREWVERVLESLKDMGSLREGWKARLEKELGEGEVVWEEHLREEELDEEDLM